MSLSQELIDIIIDEIAGEKQSLLNLALTSHACLPRARQHLFRQLCLLPLHPERTFSRFWTAERMENHVKMFIELCSHPLSTVLHAGPKHVQLTPFVKGFEVSYREVDEQSHLSAFIEVLSWLVSRSPFPFGESSGLRKRGTRANSNATYGERLFWNVQELIVSSITPAHGLTELKNLLLVSPFPRVTRLTLKFVDIRSRKCLSDIVSACPSLEYLSAGVSFDRIPIIKRPVSFPISLTHIEIPARPYKGLHKSSFRILESCATIKDLVLPLHMRNDINQFLDSSAAVKSRTLKHCKLDLNYIPLGYPISWARMINFHKVPAWTIIGAVGTFTALASTNENGTVMPNVTRIKGLNVVWEVLEQPPFEMARNLDNVLSSTVRFPCLKEVEVPVYRWFSRGELLSSGWDEVTLTVREGSRVYGVMEETMESIRMALAKCHDRGLLRMKCRCLVLS
uniref:F-box domain-containing protein n=1 Tax=Moniliophthora roreri TaxID=221103 RepID=A0A0W0FIP0_MONRR